MFGMWNSYLMGYGSYNPLPFRSYANANNYGWGLSLDGGRGWNYNLFNGYNGYNRVVY